MVSTQTETIARGYRPRPWILEVVAVETALQNSYTTVLDADVSEWPETKLIVITNTHSSYALVYKILGTVAESPNPADWVTLVGASGLIKEVTVQPSSSDYQSTNLPWRRIQVRCRNETADQAASVKVTLRSVLRSR